MILEQIVRHKKEELKHFKSVTREGELKAKVRDAKPCLDFKLALKKTSVRFAIIAEIKRRSPSKGLLRENFDPVAIARDYEEHGAAALSVLTDEHFFGGHLDHLRAVRQTVNIPVLRKDFVWDPYQIYSAREAGADAILLIAAMLEKNQVEDLRGLADELGLAVLFEIHDQPEAHLARAINADLVGVNNRDLKSFRVDVATTERLLPLLPSEALKVSESGLDDGKVLQRLQTQGVGAFLIGEAFMKAECPGKALRALLE